MSYTPPNGNEILASWAGTDTYTPVSDGVIDATWATVFNQTFAAPSASEGSITAEPVIKGRNYILPAGLEQPEGWSEDGDMWIRRADPQTISDASVGEATTWEWARIVFPCVPRPDGFIRFDFTYRVRPFAPSGIDYSAFGRLSLRNWDSIIEPVGVDSFSSLHSRIYDAAYPPLWFHFQGAVRQPNAQNIYFYWGFTRNYTPGDIDSLEFGSTTLTPGAVYIVCGEDEPHTEFGTSTVESYDPVPQERSPLGIDSLEIDEPYIWTWLQYMEQQTGPPFTEWGENPTVVITDQFLYPYEIEPPLLEENTLIEHWIRYITTEDDEPYTRFGIPITTKIDPPADQIIDLYGYGYWEPKGGLPHISHYVQFALANGTASSIAFGTPAIFTRQFIDLDWKSLTHTEYGRPGVIREYVLAPQAIRPPFAQVPQPTLEFGNWAGPAGLDSPEFGEHSLTKARFTQTIRVFQGTEDPIGEDTRIRNSDQYVFTAYDVNRDWPIGWIGEPSIKNRNRTVRMSGAFFQRFATWPLRISLNARLLAPEAIGPTSQVGKGTTVTHYVRYLQTNGQDFLWWWPYRPRIRNSAIAMHPEGFDSFDKPTGIRVQKTRRYFQHNTPFIGNEFGRPFIADAVRTLYVDKYYFVDKKTMVGTPYIGLWSQYIITEGKTFTSIPRISQHLGPFLRGFRTFSIKLDDYGRFTIRNRNREVRARSVGWPDASINHRVSHDPQYALPTGISPREQTSKPRIRDSKQIVDLAQFGAYTWECGPFTKVRHFPIPIPPTPIPTIDPTGHKNPGRAPDIDEDSAEQVGYPRIQGSLCQMEGFDSLEMGEPDCLGHSIEVRQYLSSLEFGYAQTNSTQWITQEPSEESPLLTTQWSPQRVDPTTVWCKEDTPQQAYDNNPHSKRFCKINAANSSVNCGDPFPFFGAGSVTNKNRRIYVNHPSPMDHNPSLCAPSSVVGDPSFAAPKYIRPEGIRPLRMPIPIFYPHTQWIRVKNEFSAEAYGYPSIRNASPDPPTNRSIPVPGIYSFATDESNIELKNRALLCPEDPVHTLWGNNYPMVHYPRGFTTVGSESPTTWGEETFIAYRIRHFQFYGQESLETDWETFNDKMKVTYENGRWGTGWKWVRNVSVGDTLTVSSTYASGGVTTIYAYMIPPLKLKATGMTVNHA